jgi:hypothetical protein
VVGPLISLIIGGVLLGWLGSALASISVFDFVSRYVQLNERGIGFCPFHDDEHMSFGVNTTRNYWSCFAGCSSVIEGKTIKGGSVIHFWQRWREKEGQDGSFEPTLID